MSRAKSPRRPPAAGRKRTHDATIALCMIVKNEAEDLPGCLAPIARLFDEVHVVDTGSTDGTQAIARGLGASVHPFEWCDDFGAARNESLRHARSGWVLWLDADDRLDPGEVAELRRLAAGPRNRAYYCMLSSTAASQFERSSCFQLRFLPRIEGLRFEGRVHEQAIYSLERAGVAFENCGVRIVHTGYADRAATVEKFRRNLALLRMDLAEQPDDPMLHYHLMHSLHAVGEREHAIAAGHHLLEGTNCRTRNREMFLYAHVVLARFHEEAGDLDAKERELRGALAEEPGYAPALFFLGEEAFRAGRTTDAWGLLEEVSRSGVKVGSMPVPWRPILHLTEFYLGRMEEGAGRDSEAAARFRKACEIMPENAAGWASAAQLALRMGAHPEAAACLRELLQLGEDNVTVRFNLGLALLEQGDHAAARAELARALQFQPGLAPAWLNLGNIEFREENLGAAATAYREAIRCDPGFSLAHLNLAKTLVLAGDLREAEGTLMAALAGNDPPVEALAHLGDIAYSRGDFARARDLLEAYLSREPARPTALLRLADCYAAMGAPEAALAGYHAVLRMEPGHPEAMARIELLAASAEPVTAH